MIESQNPLQADIASVLQSLVQQQTAILQQGAALLQVHGESVRLQRLLIERMLGSETEPATVTPAVAPELPQWMSTSSAAPASAASPAPTPSPSNAAATPVLTAAPDSVSVQPVADPPPAAAPDVPVVSGSASRAALYYQQRPSRVTGPTAMKPQDLELMRRLHEMSDASSLILQFGPHKGATLAQVAMNNPEYVRQLVTRAERPEVRAAAVRLVAALEAAEEHKPRAARGASRRVFGSRPGPRG